MSRQSTGKFDNYGQDPWAAPFDRAAITDHTEVVVAGGGFGGLLVGARLWEAGIRDVRIIDEAGTSAAPGTGTATRARCAISRPTSTCPSSRS